MLATGFIDGGQAVMNGLMLVSSSPMPGETSTRPMSKSLFTVLPSLVLAAAGCQPFG